MHEMKYGEINYLEKKVSRILLGTASMSFIIGEKNHDLLDAAFSSGITAFDTARGYGMSEKALGDWMYDRNNRDEIVILTKCGHPDNDGRKRINEREIRSDFAVSSQYLKTDYIDLYLLHRDDPDVPVGTIIEIFNALHSEGKVRAFGGSNWTHQRIQEANEYAYKHNLIPFSASSPNFGLANQVQDPWGGGCVSISGPVNQNARQWYQAEQMPLISYSSLGRGFFSGRVVSHEPETHQKYLDDFAQKGYAYSENFERLRRCEELAKQKHCTIPQIALSWLFHQKLNTYAIVSASDQSRIKANIDALNLELTTDECLYLNLEKKNY